MDISRLDGHSLEPQTLVLARLMADLPELFSERKLDPQKLKAALGEDAFAGQERYGLTWNGKSDCFKKIQETTTKTLRPWREESVDFDTTKNLFIEGDNLQVLKVLQRSYYGRVKMIYIDRRTIPVTTSFTATSLPAPAERSSSLMAQWMRKGTSSTMTSTARIRATAGTSTATGST